MISSIVISSDYSDGVVLAKVMEVAKEIRSGDKKRGAAPAGGRAAACLSGCRRCKEGGAAAGVMGCRGWLGGQWSGGDLRRQFDGI